MIPLPRPPLTEGNAMSLIDLIFQIIQTILDIVFFFV
jgi:hypothetical protein